MQVRASRLAGSAVALAAVLLVAAPAGAGPQPTHLEPPPASHLPDEAPSDPEEHPPGNPPSCVIPADSTLMPATRPAPPGPEVSCAPPVACIRPAVDRGPGLVACPPPTRRGGPEGPDGLVEPLWPLLPRTPAR